MPDLVVPLDSADESQLGTVAKQLDMTPERAASALLRWGLQRLAEEAVPLDFEELEQ